MNEHDSTNDERTGSRFEFRSFGQDFSRAAFRMARLSAPVPESLWERHSEESYIVSHTNDENNTKIRDGKMDIKTRGRTVAGLEQWHPLMKGEFPLPVEVLTAQVFPAFQVDRPALDQAAYDCDAFMNLVRSHPDLHLVRVHKQRFGYRLNDALSEVANVLINGARVVTINCESTRVEDVLKSIEDIGLQGVENINYLQAIKRVIGLIEKPLAN